MKSGKFATFSRRALNAALASAVVLGASGLAVNAYAATGTGTATATVLAPIAVAKFTDLVFGSFAPGAGGTVTVSTSGARTGSGVILSAVTAAPTAARFDVTGTGSATYSITYAGTATTLASTTASPASMAFTHVSDLTAGNAITGTVATGTLASGAQSIFVGGVLTVGAAQAAAADYTGAVAVVVEYN